jgi:fused signal recognition particle receptor
MSTPVLVAIIAAVVVVVIVVVVLAKRRREKRPDQLPEAAPPEPERVEPAAPEPAEAEPVEEEAPTAAPPAEAPPVEAPPVEAPPVEAPPVEAPPEPRVTAPGVRLDEKAEEEAAAKLKAAKRERKLRRLRQGLAPTRGGLITKIGSLFKGKKTIEPELLDELEETLITADVGTKTTEWFVNLLREALDRDELSDPDMVWSLLRSEVQNVLAVEAPPWDVTSAKPYTIMVVGVNGTGKTTTIGKLASQMKDQGLKVVLAAADTFRAAAVNQLEIWGRRTGCEVVKSKEGADPSSVVFDAIKKAQDESADVVIADTAGRLHTKAPLMEELKKVGRVMGKALDGAPHQVLLVLDATTGQNALQQVSEFSDALAVTGLVLTKLDGTAKGGVIIGICHEHKLPVRFIGIGEAKDDLRDFEVGDFVEALFVKEEE